MNNDENNWNTDNKENTTDGNNTWNTNTTDGKTENSDTWNTNTTDTTENKDTWNTDTTGTTTDNKDTWNTNNTGNTTNTNTTKNVDEINVSTKNRMTALMLCWFLGLFGVHRLYAGKLGSGFLFLYGTVVALLLLGVCFPIGMMTLITMVALVANDFVFLAFGQFKDCYGKTICSDKLQ